MKRTRSRKRPSGANSSALTARAIDARYGLEPVFEPSHEPDHDDPAATAFQSIQCPYCGERFDALLDTGAGAVTYIEDCQVCCQPIEFELRVDRHGAFAGLSVHRC